MLELINYRAGLWKRAGLICGKCIGIFFKSAKEKLPYDTVLCVRFIYNVKDKLISYMVWEVILWDCLMRYYIPSSEKEQSLQRAWLVMKTLPVSVNIIIYFFIVNLCLWALDGKGVTCVSSCELSHRLISYASKKWVISGGRGLES